MTAMDRAFVGLLLLQGFTTTGAKYVFVDQKMSWYDAQSYCREFHTDLAPVINDIQLQELREISGYVSQFWTGLVRNFTDREEWMWSGGGRASTAPWSPGQPNGRPNNDFGMMIHYRIHNENKEHEVFFFCYEAIVVRERVSWEEALEHCREQHNHLASLASRTETLLVQRELEKNFSTQYVWMGLRYFPGGWRWVDGEPLAYKGWVGEEPLCPALRLKCGALKVKGRMPSIDTDSSVSFDSNDTITGERLGTDTVFLKESVWEAWDCEQRLYFICS
ncbi:C-type mannose receptor 2-like [Nerophis ophidion]|uniref:C-type mannose receptor 2-like n=1 Tax=Nerophis ophidion TaxID=159077 RepID=UPI002ADFE075|nr:C-type mannose receptor 2-like [Nerophis ophidion]